ncbi:MAG TPA: PAS domain S-box protein [Syntrophorhabdales bacterium]|nr:PAS domain S-box protein [Syntrophorhabdales bacterium]
MPKQTSSSPAVPGREKRAERLAAKNRRCTPARGAAGDPSQALALCREELEAQNEELRKTKDQLEEFRVNYVDFYENAPVGYLTFNRKGLVLSMNLTAARVLGVDRSVLLKKPFSLLTTPASRDAFTRHRRHVFSSGRTETCELVLTTKAGEERFFQLESVSSSANGSATLLSVLTDVTERKKAEEAWRVSRLHLSQAMDIAHLVYWERDPATHNFIFNDPFYAFYGTTAEREGGYVMTGEEYARRFMHPDDVHLLREAVQKRESVKGREFVNDVEHRIIRRDGEVRYILARIRATRDDAGRIVRCYGANQDITERKRSEETLRQSERQYRELAELLPRPVFEADAQGRITYANRRAYESIGYAPADILKGLSLFQLVIPEQRIMAKANIEKVLAGKELAGSEYTLRRKNGSGFPALVYASAIEKDGAVTGIRGIVFDISEKKAHEEDLRTSRLHLEEAADLARIAYWEQDEATEEFIFNDAFYALYATSAEREGGFRMTPEEYGKRFVHPDDLDAFRRRLAARRTHPPSRNPIQFEHRSVRRDGEVIYVLVRHRAVTDAKGHVIKTVGVHQDITARRMMEDALRESETKLRAVLDGSRDAITVAKEGIRIFANPAFVALLGYESADELIGKPAFDAIAPESRDFVEEMVKKRLKGEPVPPLYEETMLRKDGTRLFAEVSVSYYVLKGEEFSCVILRDITERKRIEEELKLLKHSIDVYYDGAYWMDTDNRFVYVNEAACMSLGYECDELIGKRVWDINTRITPEKMNEVWQRLRREGAVVAETVHRRKDGTEFPVEVTSTYVRFGDREFNCAFARDITEKKRLEEQLRQSQKMEAVGTLAGGIAHDFNNMLAIILGNAELALDEVIDDGPRRNIKQIVKASKRARDLTRQILTFGRRSERARKALRLRPLLDETYHLLRGTLPTTIGMELDIRTESDTILADPSQIQQVVVNLATNAAFAMREKGGVLHVSLDDVTLTQQGQIPGLSPGRYVKLSVRDTGTGMPDWVRNRLFEPFFTTKRPDEGTGMGLAVVYGTVKNHEGEITVETTLGEGSVFHVFLPLAHIEASAEGEERGGVPGGKERILLVDDEPGVLQMTGQILKGLGYKVTTAPNGMAAWEIFKKRSHSFDLVITDQVMPGLTGLDLAREIFKISEGTPVILSTGYGETVSSEQARAAGISEFVMKPVSRKEVADTVRRALEDRGGMGT